MPCGRTLSGCCPRCTSGMGQLRVHHSILQPCGRTPHAAKARGRPANTLMPPGDQCKTGARPAGGEAPVDGQTALAAWSPGLPPLLHGWRRFEGAARYEYEGTGSPGRVGRERTLSVACLLGSARAAAGPATRAPRRRDTTSNFLSSCGAPNTPLDAEWEWLSSHGPTPVELGGPGPSPGPVDGPGAGPGAPAALPRDRAQPPPRCCAAGPPGPRLGHPGAAAGLQAGRQRQQPRPASTAASRHPRALHGPPCSGGGGS